MACRRVRHCFFPQFWNKMSRSRGSNVSHFLSRAGSWRQVCEAISFCFVFLLRPFWTCATVHRDFWLCHSDLKSMGRNLPKHESRVPNSTCSKAVQAVVSEPMWFTNWLIWKCSSQFLKAWNWLNSSWLKAKFSAFHCCTAECKLKDFLFAEVKWLIAVHSLDLKGNSFHFGWWHTMSLALGDGSTAIFLLGWDCETTIQESTWLFRFLVSELTFWCVNALDQKSWNVLQFTNFDADAICIGVGVKHEVGVTMWHARAVMLIALLHRCVCSINEFTSEIQCSHSHNLMQQNDEFNGFCFNKGFCH